MLKLGILGIFVLMTALPTKAAEECSSLFDSSIGETSSPSFLCRDCPFPMKIDEGRWLMPGGQIEVQIDEIRRYGAYRYLWVAIVHHESGEVWAIGSVFHHVAKKSFHAELYDHNDNPVDVIVKYQDSNNPDDATEIKISCSTCSFKHLLDPKGT